MATDGRHKTSKKIESARQTRRHIDKEHPNEYGYVRDDINTLWTSWAMTSGTSEMWRRIEQSGIEAAIKKIGKCRSDLTIISSISSDDAVNIMGVMIEFTEMLNSIRLAFEENEQDIFDSDERESRYLTETCPAILELWSNYTTFAAEFAFSFVQKSWHNSSEHRELLASVGEVLASSTKLLVVAVNMGDYHSLEDAESLRSVSIRETTKVTKDLQINLNKIYKIDEKHSALNTLLELVGWELHGVYHMSNKVLKAEMETRAPDSNFDDYKELMSAITGVIDTLRQRWANKQEENEKEQQLQVQPPQQERKASKVDNTPPVVETKQPREEYLETLQKLETAYTDFSNDAWETRRLPVMRGTGGLQMQYRMESYEQIRKFRINACAVHKRKELLDSVGLTSDYEIHSELFVVEPEGLNCDDEVVISFPLTSSKTASGKDDSIFMKMRMNGEWKDAEEIKKEKIGNQTVFTFNTKTVEAFAATSFSPRDALIVGPSGANYISEDSGKVEMTIPQDCYSSEVTLGVKTIPFHKRGYETTFLGIVTASVAVEVSLETGESNMNKHITLHIPLEETEDDTQRDTEIVVVRYNNQNVQVLDKKQISLKENANNQYSVDMKGYWCVAILRIRRIYLNMRESIKREFLIGYGIKTPCNIVTFIDDVTRQTEKQTFVMEIIEKCDVDMAVDIKRGFGLIEVKKSRSKDVLLKRGDQVAMWVDGQLRNTEAIADDNNVLTYLKGGRNTVFMRTEIKRDPEKLPDAMIFYKLVQEDCVLHSVAIMTRDLSELSTDAIIARTGLNMNISDSKHDKQKEEAAVQILKMESLMSLARELTFEEGTSLGQQLGVKPETIKKISQNVEKDHVSGNFQILCSWRGRCARATMADFLVSCLKAVGKLNYADLVMEVRTHNRGLERSDFTRMKAIQSGKSY